MLPSSPVCEKLVDPVDDVVAAIGEGLIVAMSSKGPGTAMALALELGEPLFGKEACETRSRKKWWWHKLFLMLS
jgi:hypothetical protein